MDADLVIADLSTSNANAIYELGIRHALRPNTTIVIAEEGFKFPFDITHLLIRHYEHLGKGIDAEEAETVRKELKQAIKTLLNQEDADSPEIEENRDDLEQAIQAYEKGFYLRNDYYNGINFAYLLNVRASISDKRQAIADIVFAERIRRRVIRILEPLLEKGIKDDEGKDDLEAMFWLKATLVEALFGIGDIAKAETAKEETCKEAPEQSMADTMNEQVSKLNQLISQTSFE